MTSIPPNNRQEKMEGGVNAPNGRQEEMEGGVNAPKWRTRGEGVWS